MAQAKEEKKPWDQLEGESALWYGRFAKYRMMGQERAVIAVINQERQLSGKVAARQTPGAWTMISTKFKWAERAQAWDLSQVKSTEQIHQEEADKFREVERKALSMLFIKLAQRVQMLKPEELSPDGLSHAILSVAKALEKVHGLESKTARRGGEGEEDEEFEEGLANFRRLQAQAVQMAELHAAKATGTDGQAHALPAPSSAAASTQEKQSPNGKQQQGKEIALFSR